MSRNYVRQVCILYKTILKLHKGMPAELQLIGDNYVRDEFKRHKNCKPEEAKEFMKEWSKYAITLAKQLGIKKLKSNIIGESLTEDMLNSLRDDQVQQLYDLMLSAKESTKTKDVIK